MRAKLVGLWRIYEVDNDGYFSMTLEGVPRHFLRMVRELGLRIKKPPRAIFMGQTVGVETSAVVLVDELRIPEVDYLIEDFLNRMMNTNLHSEYRMVIHELARILGLNTRKMDIEIRNEGWPNPPTIKVVAIYY